MLDDYRTRMERTDIDMMMPVVQQNEQSEHGKGQVVKRHRSLNGLPFYVDLIKMTIVKYEDRSNGSINARVSGMA
ncbi:MULTISPECIES: hypothetical protein [Bacillus]|uniref:hypothetical protein n=1 Tax=Bacillus TaxID=1386 RepID=UPI00065E1737|nr:hypothetical protein [Bacillus smithii]AKP47010.1 hypothetical protein BSM4216_1734 [Bacillus smithii]MED4885089.1 hypothetical protein [Bacillus smithii]MED4926724.1 hypothetical protein [Bacillus smithii]